MYISLSLFLLPLAFKADLHHLSAVILMYQGVSKLPTTEAPLSIARQIASEGITDGQIRDEVFISHLLS